MKNVLTITLFTVAITAFYNFVGQLVPQKEVHPPKNAEIRANMTTEEMVEAGRIIVEGKGTCKTCHNGSARFPVFDNVGAVAGTRKPGMTDVEYLAESLYAPNDFIVEPFAPGMPAVTKPPIGLTDDEVLVVIAFLQSQGGKPTVTMDTKLKYQGSAPGGAAAAAPADAAPQEQLDGKGLVAKYGCMACHALDQPIRLVGPSLFDIGARQTKAQIYEALLEPDATIAEGFPPGVMGATLSGNGFYAEAKPEDLKRIVEFLSSLRGGA